MGTKYCAASFLQITAPEMDDRILAELLDTDSDLLLSIHIRSMDQNEAIKTVKRKITDIDSMKIDAQKRAVREGFDMDIIPTDIATYAGEAKNILRDLQSRNERMFLVTFLLVNMADSKRKLDNDITRASSVAQKYNCQLTSTMNPMAGMWPLTKTASLPALAMSGTAVRLSWRFMMETGRISQRNTGSCLWRRMN